MTTHPFYSIFSKWPEDFSDLTWFEGDEGLSVDECNILRKEAENAEEQAWSPGTVGDNEEDESFRKVAVFKLDIHSDNEIGSIQEKIINRVIAANEKWWRFSIEKLTYMELLRYGDDGAGYRAHLDWGPGSSQLRKVSASILLSDPDDYDGGDLQILGGHRTELFAPRSQGSIAIFPSFMLHQVTPVTRGERWAATAWFEGPPFR
jgi:PKHD-type hydroxylase